jgi:putative ABC transport system ATP-binding protein
MAHLPTPKLAEVRNARIGFVFQSFNLLARTSALENVELPAPLLEGRRPLGAPRPGARPRSSRSGSRPRATTTRASSPAASSSASRSRARSSTALDRVRGRADREPRLAGLRDDHGFFQELNDSGITLVFVTHEPDIAQHAKRRIVLKDGEIQSDEPVVNRALSKVSSGAAS